MTDQPISLVEAGLAVDYAFVEKCEEEIGFSWKRKLQYLSFGGFRALKLVTSPRGYQLIFRGNFIGSIVYHSQNISSTQTE